MKQKIFAIMLCVILAVGSFPLSIFAAQVNQEDIVILYENDIHCAIEGYSKLSAIKQELQQTHAHVGVVSSGDYIQGSSLGVISQGEYIVQLMNMVGYDASALGNHEFDYRLSRLEELIDIMQFTPVCCNFRKIDQQTSYFKPYTMVSYGEVDIAYVGITTPTTIKTASPSQFRDENDELLYTFQPTELYDVVQQAIDAARADGADYVIALSHVGYTGDTVGLTADIEDLINSTEGFDVVLDAHSHSVIEGKTLTDKGGNEVLLSSTGTKFAYIGKLTISRGELRTELIKTEDYTKTDAKIDAYLAKINEEHAALGDRIVASSEVDLITHDADGNRLIRKQETNLGNLCADAIRASVNADIGYINGGGIRAEIAAGDITFNNLLGVFPHNNTIVLAELDGQSIHDLMEMAMMRWPEEGSFPHVSGITFSFNTEIPSSVVLNEHEEFVTVAGAYRVYDVKVYNRETGKYEPLQPDKIYTIASHNYYLIEHGSGMTMLRNAKILQNDGILDVEVLERYIVENLGGVIGEQYRNVTPHITYTEGEITPDKGLSPVIVIAIVVVAGAAVVVILLLIRNTKKATAKSSQTH